MTKLSLSKTSKLKKKKSKLSTKNTSTSTSTNTNTSTSTQKASKLSTKASSMHKKWQETATSMGGGKIILVKTDAKKQLWKLLSDNFRPMTITMIHKDLKGTIPSPLLRSCLDEMSIVPGKSSTKEEDDDDDFVKLPTSHDKKPHAKDEYTHTIQVKVGRNESSNLYFANQSKLMNGGNGMEPQSKSDFLAEKEKSKSERAQIQSSYSLMTKETARLLSEPTNAEIEELLDKENKVNEEIRSKLKESRHLKENERNRKSTIKRVEKMALIWRKRRRMCIDFLNMLEDCTEGTIRTKQCLSGNGQIEIESDETVAKEAKTVYDHMQGRKVFKRPRLAGNFRGQKNNQVAPCGVEASESFIAVMLEPGVNCSVKRIFADSK